jgi:hypothetical protein
VIRGTLSASKRSGQQGSAAMRLSKTEKLILKYVLEHPAAKDSERGILEWWLLEEEIASRAARVRRALSNLVGAGLMLKKTGLDGAAFYTANRGKFAEIRRLVAPIPE